MIFFSLLWFFFLGDHLVLPWKFHAFWKRNRRGNIVTFVPNNANPASIGPPEEVVDSYFMKRALLEAEKAAGRGEVPIGALVVRPLANKTKYEILSAESNMVKEKCDASAHAEMLAMRQAALVDEGSGWRLLNCTLYTTVEPCAMCLAGAQSFRIKRIVYGAPDLRLGAIHTYLNLLEYPHPFHNIDYDQVVSGIHHNDSAYLLRDFFRRRRQSASGNAQNLASLKERGLINKVLTPLRRGQL